ALITADRIYLSLFFHAAARARIYTLSLHDALPISVGSRTSRAARATSGWTRSSTAGSSTCSSAAIIGRSCASARSSGWRRRAPRSEEHTSELQSRFDLVCRLLLEKKKQKVIQRTST